MSALGIYALALAATVTVAVLTWLVSLARRNVAIVDSVWSPMFVVAACVYAAAAMAPGEQLLVTAPAASSARVVLMLALVSLWALRLALYITWRNWGHGEDRRYRAIRARNEPNFNFKSLYLVFVLQAVLAWVISLPLLGGILSRAPLGLADGVGALLWLTGMIFEAGGDWQLARFKASPANKGKVMDEGLWRYTRHPNYFGDFCVWWGLYLIAAAGGAWWSAPGPLLMSLLLMRVSGVALLEKDIGERRPEYAAYVRRTNAFFPGRRRGA